MHALFPVTAHIFFLREQEVLMLRRFNTGYEDGNYSVVAGHLDGGETLHQAAVREIREEVGVDVRPEDLTVSGVMQRKSDEERVDFFLTVWEWQGELLNNEPGKCDDLRWYPLDALPDNTIPYVRRALGKYLEAGERMWFDEFGWGE
jgi:8-oxo-dGTP pyrophosphatase MutT (NUDIX family)